MYAVFGNPIDHSLSPYLIGKLLNIKCCKISLPENFNKQFLLSYLKENNIFFGNVTFPYKKIFYDYSDYLKFPANNLNCSNAFIFKDDKIISTNTDGEGFFYGLKFLNYDIYKNLLKNRKLLIVGTGSTANSIAFSSKIRGINPIFISRKINNLNDSKNQPNYNKSLNLFIDNPENIFKLNIINYKEGLRLILKEKDYIIISTLPFSLISFIEKDRSIKIDNLKEKNKNDENFNDILEFFSKVLEKKMIVFDSNYKDYLSIKKNYLNYKINENIIDGIDQFLGQGLLSIYFFTGKNYLSKIIIKELKVGLINENLK